MLLPSLPVSAGNTQVHPSQHNGHIGCVDTPELIGKRDQRRQRGRAYLDPRRSVAAVAADVVHQFSPRRFRTADHLTRRDAPWNGHYRGTIWKFRQQLVTYAQTLDSFQGAHQCACPDVPLVMGDDVETAKATEEGPLGSGELASFSMDATEAELANSEDPEHISLFFGGKSNIHYLPDDKSVEQALDAQRILKGYYDVMTCSTPEKSEEVRREFVKEMVTQINEFIDQNNNDQTGAGIVIIS